jgi:hypothetical protein
LEDTITEMCQQLDNRVIERCVAIAKRRLGEVERSEEDQKTTGRKRQRSSSPLPAVAEEDVEMKQEEEEEKEAPSNSKKKEKEEIIKATFDLVDESSVTSAKEKAVTALLAKSNAETCSFCENLAGVVGRKVQGEFAKIKTRDNASWAKAVVKVFKESKF